VTRRCGCYISPLAANALFFRTLLLRKLKLVALHIYARVAESYALHPQPESLFSGIFSEQFDRPTRAEYTVPGQAGNLTQNSNHLPRGSGPSRSFGYRSVTRHRSRRQGANATYDAIALGVVAVVTIYNLFPIPRPAFPGFGGSGLELPFHG